MKKIFYLIAIAFAFVACNQTPKFTINGNIEGLADGTVYLKQRVGGETTTLDSAKSTGGKFELKGAVEVPDLYILVLGEHKQIPVLLENKVIEDKRESGRLCAILSIIRSAGQDEMKALESKRRGI